MGLLKRKYAPGLLRSIRLIAFFLLTVSPANAQPPAGSKSVDLIECGDRGLAIKILCNPRWETIQNKNNLTMTLAKTASGEITVSISKSSERGLDYQDLTPVALQRVYGYADYFKYAKTHIDRRPVIRIEGHPKENHGHHLLDYLILNNTVLYRVSYKAETYTDYRKYLPVFVKMMRSFDFLTEKNKISH